jgi:hypothetical protein
MLWNMLCWSENDSLAEGSSNIVEKAPTSQKSCKTLMNQSFMGHMQSKIRSKNAGDRWRWKRHQIFSVRTQGTGVKSELEGERFNRWWSHKGRIKSPPIYACKQRKMVHNKESVTRLQWNGKMIPLTQARNNVLWDINTQCLRTSNRGFLLPCLTCDLGCVCAVWMCDEDGWRWWGREGEG